ncbi:MAG: indole-3-glycerol phosphate synthase TrpC [Candidatus Obscuribacterales bacterium]|nr:indole-3-glycerol phosphate synthase TrpC [Candidatus Obscuribacterales bacterium]
MPGFLTEVVAHKKKEIQEKQARLPLEQLLVDLEPARGRFLSALNAPSLNLIAEIKPRSPALGVLESAISIEERIELYSRYASAISVLTDERFFGGSIELLKTLSASTKVPCLLKDFVIDPYQVYEARKAGAEAVLLIAKILERPLLDRLYKLIKELSMTVVFEVQSEAEMEIAEELAAELVLINNRNLETLQIDLNTVPRLVADLNFSTKIVAASGIENAADFLFLRPFASCFLVGSALMKAGSPQEKFEEFLEAEAQYQASKEGEKCRP